MVAPKKARRERGISPLRIKTLSTKAIGKVISRLNRKIEDLADRVEEIEKEDIEQIVAECLRKHGVLVETEHPIGVALDLDENISVEDKSKSKKKK